MWGRESKEFKTLCYQRKLFPYRNLYQGQDCIIMGSGPSLNDIPIEFLKRFKVFAVNGSYRYYHPDFMVTSDASFPQFSEARVRCNNLNTPFFINWFWLTYKQENELAITNPNEVYVPTYECDSDYTEKNTKLINHIFHCYENQDYFEQYGPSVLCSGVPELAIPLALYMGFQKIYLAGVDFTKNPTEANHHFDNKQEDFDKVSWVTWGKTKGNKYGDKGLWDVKKFSLEMIADTCVKDRVFNLSEISTIQRIPKIHYSQIT